jgi:hypothetical protein
VQQLAELGAFVMKIGDLLEHFCSSSLSVMPRFKRGIQYSAASRQETRCCGLLDHPLSRVMTSTKAQANHNSTTT